jgi:hypothetical protein
MHNWGYLMRSINNGTFKGSPTAGPLRSGGLLSRDELALPAVCGQTGKPFVMVVRRQGRGMLELIRAVAVCQYTLRHPPTHLGISVAGVGISWSPPGISVGSAARSCYLIRTPMQRRAAVQAKGCQRIQPWPFRHSM